MKHEDRKGLEPMTAREVILEIRAVMLARGHTLRKIDTDLAVEHSPPAHPGSMAGGTLTPSAEAEG